MIEKETREKIVYNLTERITHLFGKTIFIQFFTDISYCSI